jgi:hypothetical protein
MTRKRAMKSPNDWLIPRRRKIACSGKWLPPARRYCYPDRYGREWTPIWRQGWLEYSARSRTSGSIFRPSMTSGRCGGRHGRRSSDWSIDTRQTYATRTPSMRMGLRSPRKTYPLCNSECINHRPVPPRFQPKFLAAPQPLTPIPTWRAKPLHSAGRLIGATSAGSCREASN